MLYYVASFSSTTPAVLCGVFLLHAPCCIIWGASLTRPMLFLCGFSLACPMLYYVGCFSYTPRPIVVWGVYLTLLILCNLEMFSYTPHAILYGGFSSTRLIFIYFFCWEFRLHAPCYFFVGVSLTRPMQFCMGSFSYTPHAILCGDILLQAP